MPYILYKTDGTKLTTVDDATLDLSTDLSFVGRNYSGYGQAVNENFLKLLENFSNDTPPGKPIKGQLWFDKTNSRLNISYDGKSFKGIASIFVQPATPISSAVVRGDLWWDSDAFQLKAFDGNRFQVVGPFDPAAGRATWIPGEEETGFETAVTTPISKSVIDDEVIAIVSGQTFTTTNSVLVEPFPQIKRGITLVGADPDTGRTAISLNTTTSILWGTAAHALNADLAVTATFAIALLNGGAPSLLSSRSTGTLFYSTATTSTQSWTIMERDASGNVYSNIFNGVATSARYADLAERYESDKPYEPGTVLIIGGSKEVTTTTIPADTAVIGIVSTNPGLMMNADAGNHDSHPFIALRGRVPCQVYGPVNKGDLLVTSEFPGHARSWKIGDNENSVFAKALESFNNDSFGIIEVVVI